MTYCPYCAGDEFAAISYPDAQFRMCRACGVVFKEFTEQQHSSLAASHYTVQSWGYDKKVSLSLHGPIIRNTLDACNRHQPFSAAQSFLDVGAGVGVLEEVLFEMLGTRDVNITPLEPVPEIAKFLQQEYPALKVVNADLEDFPARDSDKFDVVFCLGVDYLFKDLDRSLDILSKIGNGRWIFSRAVFLDMPSYFGSQKIKTFAELVAPNRLISTFMFHDQYHEMLTRHFKVNSHGSFEYTYAKPKKGEKASTVIFVADCSAAPESYPKPILAPERALKRLAELGVSLS